MEFNIKCDKQFNVFLKKDNGKYKKLWTFLVKFC